MGKFEQEAKDLLAAIGGKENVTAVTHCATRMRFVLGDDKKADVKTIEAIPAVKGTFTNAGQFQVIIGNDVPIFYNDFTAVSGIEGVSKEAAKSSSACYDNSGRNLYAIDSSFDSWGASSWSAKCLGKYPIQQFRWKNNC